MATTTRQATKTITMPPAAEESVPEPVRQRKQADSGRFRLQVDRQTKASYATYEAAATAGARDISAFGGWRAFVAQMKLPA